MFIEEKEDNSTAKQLIWKSLCFDIIYQSKTRNILSDISGAATEGELIAVIGPSGSGKTSFINILANRVPYAKEISIHGELVFRSKNKSSYPSARDIAYIGQDEKLFSFLTVRETLSLALSFHNHGKSEQENDVQTESIIRELGLVECGDCMIGSQNKRGISGGEYKRVLIGKELINNPFIIFMDEPTSGLDSFQALSVMETLKTLSNNNRIVFTVVHQPRSSIYELFNRVLLLSCGKTMYYGPAADGLLYFSHIGFVCPSQYNPVDYYLDVISIDYRSLYSENTTKDRVEQLYQSWMVSLLHSETTKLCIFDDDNQVDSNEYPPVNDSHMVLNCFDVNAIMKTKANFIRLYWRSTIEIIRNYASLAILVSTQLFFAILLALIYQNLGHSVKNAQDRIGLIYFIILNQTFGPLVGVLNVFPSEKIIVYKEVTNQSYNLAIYYVARVLSEIPKIIIVSVMFCSILYWSVGLNPNPIRFIIFMVVIIIQTFCSASIGFFVGSIASSVTIANALGPPLIIIFILFGGFFINKNSLPVGSEWVTNLSPSYWSFQALMINEFDGQNFDCHYVTETSTVCAYDGSVILANLSIKKSDFVISFVALVLLSFGFQLLAFIGLVCNQVTYE
eukprot:gene11115-14918_t